MNGWSQDEDVGMYLYSINAARMRREVRTPHASEIWEHSGPRDKAPAASLLLPPMSCQELVWGQGGQWQLDLSSVDQLVETIEGRGGLEA